MLILRRLAKKKKINSKNYQNNQKYLTFNLLYLITIANNNHQIYSIFYKNTHLCYKKNTTSNYLNWHLLSIIDFMKGKLKQLSKIIYKLPTSANKNNFKLLNLVPKLSTHKFASTHPAGLHAPSLTLTKVGATVTTSVRCQAYKSKTNN